MLTVIRPCYNFFTVTRPHVSIAFLAIELAFYNVDECLHFLLDKAHSVRSAQSFIF